MEPLHRLHHIGAGGTQVGILMDTLVETLEVIQMALGDWADLEAILIDPRDQADLEVILMDPSLYRV